MTALSLYMLLTATHPQGELYLHSRLSLATTAMWQVESGGRRHPPAGDGGRAVGPLQIWPIRVADCNRIVGSDRWTLADRESLDESVAMFVTSCLYYWPRGTIEQWCRHWNGSPTRGPSQQSTITYWQRCRKEL